jgi:hypothetical protein
MAGPEKEIRTHETNLRDAFWNPKDLGVHVARISVLFEDLRLEYTGAHPTESFPALEIISRNYRYYYFVRRLLVSLDEFASALHQINANGAWKAIRKTLDTSEEKRWHDAVTFFSNHRKEWQDLRNWIGGHFKESSAAFAVDNFLPDEKGKMAIVLNHSEKTGGARLYYTEQIVAIALTQPLGPGPHATATVQKYIQGFFSTVEAALNHAVAVGHVIAAAYLHAQFDKS